MKENDTVRKALLAAFKDADLQSTKTCMEFVNCPNTSLLQICSEEGTHGTRGVVHICESLHYRSLWSTGLPQHSLAAKISLLFTPSTSDRAREVLRDILKEKVKQEIAERATK